MLAVQDTHRQKPPICMHRERQECWLVDRQLLAVVERRRGGVAIGAAWATRGPGAELELASSKSFSVFVQHVAIIIPALRTPQ
jgi:hypothetical protein